MQRVLLRVFPSPVRQDVVGMEKVVEVEEGSVFIDGDEFYIQELGRSLRVEKRLDEKAEGCAYALHLLAKPTEVLALVSKGWKPIPRHCPFCQQR
ncbi:MAG TPA: hypothetical protein VGE23_00190 [Candidatus Paceibacterota bacterium]